MCAYTSNSNAGEPVAPRVITEMVKENKEHFDSGSTIRFQDSNNDVPLTMTTDVGGTCNLVAGGSLILLRSVKSNRPEMDVSVDAGVPTLLQCNNGDPKVHGTDPQGNATHSTHCFDTGKESVSTILLLRVISNNRKHRNMAIGTFSPVVRCSYDLWISNNTIMRQLCRSMRMMYRPIDRGRDLQRPFRC